MVPAASSAWSVRRTPLRPTTIEEKIAEARGHYKRLAAHMAASVRALRDDPTLLANRPYVLAHYSMCARLEGLERDLARLINLKNERQRASHTAARPAPRLAADLT